MPSFLIFIAAFMSLSCTTLQFKYKKVVETTNFVNLMQEIQKFLQEKARKLEEKGLLPKPTPPMFYINYAKKTLTINFYYEK